MKELETLKRMREKLDKYTGAEYGAIDHAIRMMEKEEEENERIDRLYDECPKAEKSTRLSPP